MLVCDESALFRRHLVLALEQADDVEVVGEAPDADVARSAAMQNAPDLAVLGGHLPPIGGVRTAAALRETNPGIDLASSTTLTTNERNVSSGAPYALASPACSQRGSADETVVRPRRAPSWADGR